MKKYITLLTLFCLVFSSFFISNLASAEERHSSDREISECVVLGNNLWRYKTENVSSRHEIEGLQNFLYKKGYLGVSPTGHFDNKTLTAVKIFQAKHKLYQSGYVGSLTRSKIREESCNTKTPNTTGQAGCMGNNQFNSITGLPCTTTPPSTTDKTIPSRPTGLTAVATSSSQINLSWTPSTDNVAVTGYKVLRGGVQIATSVATTYSDTGLTASTTYLYTISAYDAAGNNSASSVSASATTLAVATTPPTTVGYSCTIDLKTNTNNCNNALTALTEPQQNNQAVMKVNLDPSTGYTKAKFDIKYSLTTAIAGWTADVGDSSTNDGWAGDANSQQNDAEMQILDNGVTVYGNDYTPSNIALDQNRLLVNTASITSLKGKTVSMTVSDSYLNWSLDNVSHPLSSPYIYALTGQADNQGPVNYDVYASFNRVVGNSSRSGTGAESVTVTLY